jgi:hypothetical protein
MHEWRNPLPDSQMLTPSLNAIFSGNHSPEDHITVLARQPNSYASTFPSEVVTCQLAQGSELRLLCKYTAGHSHNSYGHRGGVSYEAEVYRHVLQPLQVPTPTFYGVHTDAISRIPIGSLIRRSTSDKSVEVEM